MKNPTDSFVRLPTRHKTRDRQASRLVENFRISKRMRPFVGRMRMRLADFDRTDQAKAVQFKRNCQEMKGILESKNIPKVEADHAIAQTLEAAADHQLQGLRQSDIHQHLLDSAGDLRQLIADLQRLAEAIAKLPPVSKKKLNAIVVEHTVQFFDTETFAALIHGLAGALPELEPKRRAQDVLDTIYQPVAGVVRTSPPKLIELWEMMPAETRRQVEQQVRNSAAITSTPEFFRLLVFLLRKFLPQAKRGRLPTVQRRYIEQVGKIWTGLGLEIGLAYDGDRRCNIDSTFQRFARLALAAVSGDSVISRRQIANAKENKANRQRKAVDGGLRR